ncbi:hypothetical protein KY092_16750 [Natronomonas gomsonensis]|uniref:hypothetical protein n=1 Tax=Natronomonas gomsonensis TaxID=1046043 RepID=UPI0020CA6E0B|nr:hypothetical protein [Natronomonas gomsonensis]MCY4732204.1 hypothetical protein [Natronomonas gomsonensis]
MRSVTELIDAIHDIEEGDTVTVETEAEQYRGVVTRSEYDAPGESETGVVRVRIRLKDRTSPDRLELRTSASPSRKFPRPKLHVGGFAGDAEGEPLGSVADITVEASDI